MPSLTTAQTKYSDKEVVFQEKKVLLIWSFTTWLVVMNTTMFNVALPTIVSEFALSSSTASWIVSGYSIAFAISTLTFSRLSDFIPISRLLLIGILILGVSSIVGFFSSHFYLLLVSRIFQAIGAGAVPGLGLVLVRRYIPIFRRGKAMAFIVSSASLAFGLGPVIGGIITQYLGWKYLFAVTGITLLFIPLFMKLLPNEKVQKGHFDVWGAILTAFSVTVVLLSISSFSLVVLAMTVVVVPTLWIYLHKVQEPFIQPKILKDKQFLKLLFIGFATFVTNFSTMFLMPVILTLVHHKSPLEIGLIIFPGAAIGVIAAQFSGRLIDRLGNLSFIVIGQIFLCVGTLLFALLSTISPYFIILTYLFISIGFSVVNTSISNEVASLLPLKDIGSGAGLSQMMQFFGGSFGVTVSGLLLALQTGMPTDLVYRNIFIFILVILLISIAAYYYYYRQVKSIRQLTNHSQTL